MRRLRPRVVLLGAVLAATVMIAPVRPGPRADWDRLDVDSWLRMPGVRLLAVEFFADWCAPCKEAIPKWKRLHDQYRDRGFRLVVVAVQSQGRCASYGWSPDGTVCDYEGNISKAWRAETLPQAFLWSWQGQLLVSHGRVEDVERAVESYLRALPRILIETPDPMLRGMLRAEMARTGKVEVVASDAEDAELRRLRARYQGLQYADGNCPTPGQALPPNSVLKASVASIGQGKRLALEVFSLEKGCIVASAYETVSSHGIEAAVASGVAKLLMQLVVAHENPGGHAPGSPGIASQPTTPRISGGTVTTPQGKLVVAAMPAEATITVTGPEELRETSGSSWERASLKPGEYTVTVAASGYETERHVVTVQADDVQVIKVRLQHPGKLEVRGTPVGARVQVSGPGGLSADKGLPLMIDDAPRGLYHIKVTREGYADFEQDVTVAPNETATVAATLERVTIASGADATLPPTRPGEQLTSAGPRLRPLFWVALASTAALAAGGGVLYWLARNQNDQFRTLYDDDPAKSQAESRGRTYEKVAIGLWAASGAAALTALISALVRSEPPPSRAAWWRVAPLLPGVTIVGGF